VDGISSTERHIPNGMYKKQSCDNLKCTLYFYNSKI